MTGNIHGFVQNPNDQDVIVGLFENDQVAIYSGFEHSSLKRPVNKEIDELSRENVTCCSYAAAVPLRRA